MPEEPFYDRFRRILEEHDLRPELAATIMETSVDVIRRLSDGRTKQAKLDEALRLCEKLGVDPWYLAFGRPRTEGVSLLVADHRDDRLSKLEAWVDVLTDFVGKIAGAEGERILAEIADEQRRHRKSVGA